MIKEIGMSAWEAQKENSKLSEKTKFFDPDKRLKLEKPNKGLIVPERASDNMLDKERELRDGGPSTEKFSPDKRLERTLDRNKTYTTSAERIKQADISKGEWLGKVGNSEFRPSSELAKKALESFNQTGIRYKDGNPDFSKCSVEKVQIKGMSSVRERNFAKADKEAAAKWNAEGKFGKTDWTRSDVRTWRHENRYSWHERIDKKTMDLVQRDIHDECKHFGGVSECKRMERVRGGFDA